jgi:hypothetical protein
MVTIPEAGLDDRVDVPEIPPPMLVFTIGASL